MVVENPLLLPPAVGDNAPMEADPPKAEPPKRKRRWFQFSLRTLMIFTLLCAIGSAWVAHRMQQKRKDREIVAAIVKVGGCTAWYDYQRGQLPATPEPTWCWRDAEPFGPVWLRKVLGENFFSEVGGVYFGSAEVTDADMIHLIGLTKLQWLVLEETKVTDVGLVNLNGLTELQHLDLAGGARITDAGLESLRGLAQLQSLDLHGTKVTDAGLVHLKGLKQLQSLTLTRTKITDNGLVHLNGLTQLVGLYLVETNVAGDGLINLRGLNNLEYLGLGHTKITNAGLENLKGMIQLRTLDLTETSVTDVGVNGLQKSLPNCKIWVTVNGVTRQAAGGTNIQRGESRRRSPVTASNSLSPSK